MAGVVAVAVAVIAGVTAAVAARVAALLLPTVARWAGLWQSGLTRRRRLAAAACVLGMC